MAESIKLVRLYRSEPAKPGGPTEADVHPDEVSNWCAAGWYLAGDDPAFIELVNRPRTPKPAIEEVNAAPPDNDGADQPPAKANRRSRRR